MLKKIYTIGVSVCLALMILTAAGCSNKKRMVYAEYIMPPIAISDVTSIEKINIVKPKISLSGISRKTFRDINNVFSNAIVNDFSSKLYYNGYLKPADEVYGDVNGLKYVRTELANSKHGYDVKIVKERKQANLKVTADIKFSRTTGMDTINVTLVNQTYSIATNDKGVPFAQPNKPTKQIITKEIPYIEVKAKGRIVCSLYDFSGKKIYSRDFNDLEFENKAGGNAGSNAEDPYLVIAQNLFNDAISKVVKDISPHRETRSLTVNEKGDSSAVALIKGTAFFDAMDRLGSITDKEQETIEKESAEINSKYDELIEQTEDAEKKAALEQERTQDLIAATKDSSPDYENMAIILEIIGDRSEALEYYKMAAKFDPENINANKAVLRVKEMVDASNKLTDPTKIDNYQNKKFTED